MEKEVPNHQPDKVIIDLKRVNAVKGQNCKSKMEPKKHLYSEVYLPPFLQPSHAWHIEGLNLHASVALVHRSWPSRLAVKKNHQYSHETWEIP